MSKSEIAGVLEGVRTTQLANVIGGIHEVPPRRRSQAALSGALVEVVFCVPSQLRGLTRSPFAAAGSPPVWGIKVCKKDNMAAMVERCRRVWPDELSFCPPTWRLPADTVACDAALEKASAPAGKKNDFARVFIAKPADGAQGTGIKLIRRLSELPGSLENRDKQAFVVQPYISNPALIEGFKFDLRLYALIVVTSAGGLETWLFRDGLVRLCTTPYAAVSDENINDTGCHLTNFSLNKKAPSFERTNDLASGSKRALSACIGQLFPGPDPRPDPSIPAPRCPREKCAEVPPAPAFWKNVDHLVATTVAAVTPVLDIRAQPEFSSGGIHGEAQVDSSGRLKRHSPSGGHGGKFHILGVDVLVYSPLPTRAHPLLLALCLLDLPSQMRAALHALLIFCFAKQVDSDGMPHLLEINANPSLNCSSAVPLSEGAPDQSAGRETCSCAAHPEVHFHEDCVVDLMVKTKMVESALRIVTGCGPAPADAANGAAPTFVRVLPPRCM